MVGLPFLEVCLALDSAVLGAALGLGLPDPARRRQLVLAFGFCDGLASFLG
jgi:hypothetical protein